MEAYNASKRETKREDPPDDDDDNGDDDDDDLPEETEEMGVWKEENYDEDEWLACNAVIVMQLCHSDAVISLPYYIANCQK